MSLRAAVSPFVVHPQQVRAEDDGDVSGRHLVHVLVFSQFGEEFDQISVDKKTGKLKKKKKNLWSRAFFSSQVLQKNCCSLSEDRRCSGHRFHVAVCVDSRYVESLLSQPGKRNAPANLEYNYSFNISIETSRALWKCMDFTRTLLFVGCVCWNMRRVKWEMWEITELCWTQTFHYSTRLFFRLLVGNLRKMGQCVSVCSEWLIASRPAAEWTRGSEQRSSEQVWQVRSLEGRPKIRPLQYIALSISVASLFPLPSFLCFWSPPANIHIPLHTVVQLFSCSEQGCVLFTLIWLFMIWHKFTKWTKLGLHNSVLNNHNMSIII